MKLEDLYKLIFNIYLIIWLTFFDSINLIIYFCVYTIYFKFFFDFLIVFIFCNYFYDKFNIVKFNTENYILENSW